MRKFEQLSNDDLTHTLKIAVEQERRLTVQVIELLEETERRQLYLAMGFGSLMEYAVNELSYSESAAYRRISARRLSRELPEVKEALVRAGV